MADYGAEYADKKLRSVDKQLQKEYGQAEKELKKKLAEFTAKSAARDKYKKKQLEAGIITEEEYQSWLKGQVFQKKRWEAKIRQMQFVLHSHNEQAAKMIHENKLDVYNENYFYQTYEMEMVTGASFDLYSTEAVTKLVRDRDQLLPEWKVDQKKDYNWNYEKVNNAVTQGILQGESVDKIMNRLAENLSSQNESKMRMFARTAITGAQNAGRQQQMNDAAKLGIEQLKQWLATLDGKTRDVHRHLDGQEVPFNESFDSDLGKIKYPGDPEAAPANVYNCRCTVITIYPKYRQEQDDWRSSETIDGLTYQQWKTELDKKRKESNKVTHGKEVEREKLINSIIENMQKNAFNGAPSEEFMQAIMDDVRNMDENMLRIIDKTMGNVKVNWYEKSLDGHNSHYTPGTGVVTLYTYDQANEKRSEWAMRHTFWHEYGHFVDDAAISKSGYGYDANGIHLRSIKSMISKDNAWQIAAASDTNRLLMRYGVGDIYSCKAGDYSAWMYKDGNPIDPRKMDIETQVKLNGIINRWADDVSGLTRAYNYFQEVGKPQAPKYNDYVEIYFTPKRNLPREREIYPGAKEDYQKAVKEFYKKNDEWEATHDYWSISDEQVRLTDEATERRKHLRGVSDSFDGGVSGAFTATIGVGGHDADYYCIGKRGLDETVANTFAMLAMNDEIEQNAMNDLCPNTFALTKGVILSGAN